jgi:hypothetical protein
MIICIDPHLHGFAMSLGYIGIAFSGYVAPPALISSMYRDGQSISWVFCSVLISFRHIGLGITFYRRICPKNDTRKQIIKKHVIKCLFCKKELALEQKGSHILSDDRSPTDRMPKHENTETFTITQAEFKALQIIEKDTGLPMGVQLLHAHARWAAKKDRATRKRIKK